MVKASRALMLMGLGRGVKMCGALGLLAWVVSAQKVRRRGSFAKGCWERDWFERRKRDMRGKGASGDRRL